MKKLFTVIVSTALILAVFTSCGDDADNSSSGGSVGSEIASMADNTMSRADNAKDDTADGIVGDKDGTDDSADGMIGNNGNGNNNNNNNTSSNIINNSNVIADTVSQ